MTLIHEDRATTIRRKIGNRITYANIMATVAVFISLSGLAVAANTIRSSDIVNNTVQSKDIRNGNRGVQSPDVRDNSLGLADISAAAESSFATPPLAFSLNAGSGELISSNGTLYTDSLVLLKPTKLFVIGRIYAGLTCGAGGACMQKHAVFVDGTYVDGTSVVQTGLANSSNPNSLLTLVGITTELAAGSHTLTIQRGDVDSDWGGASSGTTHIAAFAVSS